jgi:hypothetical protein
MQLIHHNILTVLVTVISVSSFTNINAYSINNNSRIKSHQISTTTNESQISATSAATVRKQTQTATVPSMVQKGISTLALTAAITLSSSTAILPAAHADIEIYDATSSITTGEDTIDIVLQSLKEGTGDVTKSFKAMEAINDIITEGKGVGGSVGYNGVRLERGYVADEDTTIYNPGLTLLTESEKTSLVDAMIANRKGNVASNTWSQDNEYAFDSLKTRLDPLHMVELKGYLKFLPFLGGAMYLVALGVQQFARGLFEVAYVVSALVVFIPIFIFIAAGV